MDTLGMHPDRLARDPLGGATHVGLHHRRFERSLALRHLGRDRGVVDDKYAALPIFGGTLQRPGILVFHPIPGPKHHNLFGFHVHDVFT